MTDKPQFQIPDIEPEQLHSVHLCDYKQRIELTDTLAEDDLSTVLLGLFGEVGSVMAITKKLRREEKAYAGYRDALIEELGDTLWYFNALCRRLNYEIEDIFSNVIRGEDYGKILVASDLSDGPFSHIATAGAHTPFGVLRLSFGE
ncbi:MAG: nucleoside triphosphate pyrophosphohydrolase family protein, partial [Gammaproteobacteria bacterium]|nr:nucleoside triphosphate pyrophosphohydrolase family protein [Gammaproteobacteria bacterium]